MTTNQETSLQEIAAKWRERADDLDASDVIGLTHQLKLRDCADELDAALARSEAQGECWRCFHCDEVFTTGEAAAEHFGTHEGQRPACLIDAAEYRRMEALQARYADEDADVHRTMHGMRSEHAEALRRAEEAGYAKGLRDSGKCPCAIATPPTASGDDLIARLRIIATDYEPGSILRNTLDEAIRRLAAVAPAGNALPPPPAEGEAA